MAGFQLETENSASPAHSSIVNKRPSFALILLLIVSILTSSGMLTSYYAYINQHTVLNVTRT